jgi:hypothetical protein
VIETNPNGLAVHTLMKATQIIASVILDCTLLSKHICDLTCSSAARSASNNNKAGNK